MCLSVSTSQAFAQRGVTDGTWPHYRGDAGGTRYAALDAINRDNVGNLEIAWTWHSKSFGPEPELRG